MYFYFDYFCMFLYLILEYNISFFIYCILINFICLSFHFNFYSLLLINTYKLFVRIDLCFIINWRTLRLRL